VLGELHLVTRAGVVEVGRDVGDETHVSTHRQYPADHAVTMT